MNKLAIWLVSVVIIAVAIAAGFFYTQNKTQNSKPDTQSDVQAKEKEVVTEYPLKMGTTKDDFILRVTTRGVVLAYPHGIKTDIPILAKIEILNHNKIIYIENFNNETKYGFLGFRIFKGKNKEYLAYGKALLHTDAEEEYSVLHIKNDTDVSKVSGNIYGWPNVGNPKIDEHIYQLVDDKYIISTFWDSYFTITAYYEIEGENVHFADREHEIKQDSISPMSIKNGDTIIIYANPDMKVASSNITLTENMPVKLISVKYINNSKQIIHVQINGKEGWITEEDLSLKLGINPAP